MNKKLSRIVLGMWRLLDWNMSDQELSRFIKQAIELDVTTFDHADIYGNYECEAAFGKVLKHEPSLRSQMQIVTKCGIKLTSGKFPNRAVKHYDYSDTYIIEQVEQSLKKLQTDYIDVLLLHRPSPFFNPDEVVSAFNQLKSSGKVNHLGVSNFTAQQVDLLNQCLEEPVFTNQIELSPYCLEHFENGTIDYCTHKKITPMAWSPLAGGKLLKPSDEKSARVYDSLLKISQQLDVSRLDSIIYAWLLKHPSNIIPVLGTGKIERVKAAVDALSIDMSLEQWFSIYTAALGKDVP